MASSSSSLAASPSLVSSSSAPTLRSWLMMPFPLRKAALRWLVAVGLFITALSPPGALGQGNASASASTSASTSASGGGINGPPVGYWTLISVTAGTASSASSTSSKSGTLVTTLSIGMSTTSATTTASSGKSSSSTSSTTTTTSTKTMSTTTMTMSASKATSSSSSAKATTSSVPSSISTTSSSMKSTSATQSGASSKTSAYMPSATSSTTTTPSPSMTSPIPSPTVTVTMPMMQSIPNRYKCRMVAGGVVSSPGASSSIAVTATMTKLSSVAVATTGSAMAKSTTAPQASTTTFFTIPGTIATGGSSTSSTAKMATGSATGSATAASATTTNMKIGSNGLFPSYNVDAATLLQTMLTAISNFPTKPDIVALTSSIKAVDPGLDTAALLKTLSAASTATLSEQAFTNFVVSLGASTDAIAANGGISSLVMAMIADLSKTTATDAVSAVMQTLATYGVTLNSVADVASKLMAGLAALLGQK